jgi:hypothetical protein
VQPKWVTGQHDAALFALFKVMMIPLFTVMLEFAGDAHSRLLYLRIYACNFFIHIRSAPLPKAALPPFKPISMASSTPTYDPGDRLQQIVRDVQQKTNANPKPQPTQSTYHDRRNQAQQVKKMSRGIKKSDIRPCPSPELSDEDEVSDAPSNNGELLPVRVTLASGIDLEDFITLVPVSRANIANVSKIRNTVATEFAADLATLAAPEELRVFAYRFKVVGFKDTKER